MWVEPAFFKGNEFLCHGTIVFDREQQQCTLASESGHAFEISYSYDEPACRFFIRCIHDGERFSRSAMGMGVHTSGDWEAISLAEPYELGFRCHAEERGPA